MRKWQQNLTQDADSQERHSIFRMFPAAKMSSSLILINSTVKKFSWCTARTKWLIQTGLRQREQSSLSRRSWHLIRATQRDKAGAAITAGECSLCLSCADIHAAKTRPFSLFYLFPAFSAAGRWGLVSMPCSAWGWVLWLSRQLKGRFWFGSFAWSGLRRPQSPLLLQVAPVVMGTSWSSVSSTQEGLWHF